MNEWPVSVVITCLCAGKTVVIGYRNRTTDIPRTILACKPYNHYCMSAYCNAGDHLSSNHQFMCVQITCMLAHLSTCQYTHRLLYHIADILLLGPIYETVVLVSGNTSIFIEDYIHCITY